MSARQRRRWPNNGQELAIRTAYGAWVTSPPQLQPESSWPLTTHLSTGIIIGSASSAGAEPAPAAGSSLIRWPNEVTRAAPGVPPGHPRRPCSTTSTSSPSCLRVPSHCRVASALVVAVASAAMGAIEAIALRRLVAARHSVVARRLCDVLLVFIVGVGFGVHRYWSHKVYTATKPLKLFLAFLSLFVGQGGPVDWAYVHLHHRICEHELDYHSRIRWGAWLLVRARARSTMPSTSPHKRPRARPHLDAACAGRVDDHSARARGAAGVREARRRDAVNDDLELFNRVCGTGRSTRR